MRRQGETHLYLWASLYCTVLYVGQLAAAVCPESSPEGSEKKKVGAQMMVLGFLGSWFLGTQHERPPSPTPC